MFIIVDTDTDMFLTFPDMKWTYNIREAWVFNRRYDAEFLCIFRNEQVRGAISRLKLANCYPYEREKLCT